MEQTQEIQDITNEQELLTLITNELSIMGASYGRAQLLINRILEVRSVENKDKP